MVEHAAKREVRLNQSGACCKHPGFLQEEGRKPSQHEQAPRASGKKSESQRGWERKQRRCLTTVWRWGPKDRDFKRWWEMLCWRRDRHGKGRGTLSLTSMALPLSCYATFGKSLHLHLTSLLIFVHLGTLTCKFFGVRLSFLQAYEEPTATRLWTQPVHLYHEAQQNPMEDEKLLLGLGHRQARLIC